MRTALRRGLTAALKKRDRVAASVLRSALAAIENAEAVPGENAPCARSDGEHIAGAAIGNGAADVPRRELSAAEVVAIVDNEVRERSHAANEYERLGREDQAARLRAEAAILHDYLPGNSMSPLSISGS